MLIPVTAAFQITFSLEAKNKYAIIYPALNQASSSKIAAYEASWLSTSLYPLLQRFMHSDIVVLDRLSHI